MPSAAITSRLQAALPPMRNQGGESVTSIQGAVAGALYSCAYTQATKAASSGSTIHSTRNGELSATSYCFGSLAPMAQASFLNTSIAGRIGAGMMMLTSSQPSWPWRLSSAWMSSALCRPIMDVLTSMVW
ncbi:hypothetical protein G6F57_019691 [Rhizopus arrhizus]|nr:hypothetical protein G6F57_019691 [Rhizopus arrhizus]